MRRLLVLGALALVAVAATAQLTVLPTGWRIARPAGAVASTGTMPQGIALSPDDTKLAVIEAGVNPPALRILSVPNLTTIKVIALKDAFGAPVWSSNDIVWLPGASSNALVGVNVPTGSVVRELPFGGYPDAIAIKGGRVAAVGDLSRDIYGDRVSKDILPASSHPAAVAFDRKGNIYVANKAGSTVTVVSPDGKASEIPVDLHPSALLAADSRTPVIYVACADSDTVDVIDEVQQRVIDRIDVGLPQGPGASPNALAIGPDGTLYVSLGNENAVAAIVHGKVSARVPTGWYPTGVAADAHNVYVSNGKGEGSHANPEFGPHTGHGPGYVGSLLVGSIRAIPHSALNAQSTAQAIADIPSPQPTPPQTVVRPNGPIKHVIYIIKENRTYDQVLGDVPGADGDPKLTWFGEKITPNQHALATRFGIFDNTYADAQVSASGHNWSTAAFANDYLERFWPTNYGGRRDLYDFENGAVASTPRNGYLWDDANKHGVSFRDYGEFVTHAVIGGGFVTTSMPGLKGHIDERYAPFDLQVSDETRIDEWQKEFAGYLEHGDLPSLEIVRLPNDHTSGTTPGMLTPQAFVAQNDHALGRLVDVVSHSKYWSSTAIFAIEDDAQNGPDHVDDQRTTLYLASPYAAPGVHHAHYSTSGVMRTMELLLGLPAMSIYDATAPPLYDAFRTTPVMAPFEAIPAQTDVTERNKQTAYGASKSAAMDFTRADAANEDELNDILRHVAGKP